MNDFKQVIDWHGTKAAERQYDGHDNIMHRMYGGVYGAGAYQKRPNKSAIGDAFQLTVAKNHTSIEYYLKKFFEKCAANSECDDRILLGISYSGVQLK